MFSFGDRTVEKRGVRALGPTVIVSFGFHFLFFVVALDVKGLLMERCRTHLVSALAGMVSPVLTRPALKYTSMLGRTVARTSVPGSVAGLGALTAQTPTLSDDPAPETALKASKPP